MVQLNQLFHKRTNWSIVFIPMVLTGIGILSIASSTAGSSFDNSVFKQAAWLGISLLAMFSVSLIPTELLRKWSNWIVLIAWFTCFLPKIPGFSLPNAPGGAMRWVRLGPLTFQPSELLFTAVVLKASDMFTKKNHYSRFVKLCVAGVLILVVAFPLLLQPDMGSTVVASACIMGVFVESVDIVLPLILGGTLSIPIIIGMISMAGYRKARLAAFLDPWKDPQGKGFQIIQGLIAFANGGLLGQGLGYGFQKLNYLPAAYTDYIFAAIAEELGFIGAAFVLLLFLMWFLQLFRAYLRVHIKDKFRGTLIWGIAFSVLFSLLINLAGVTKFIPLTGIAVPFITYGGTSLVSTWMKVGILLRLESDSWQVKQNEQNK
ncbi:MAG: FtsW/RodA/SpoVE family cell cycle protein [Synergistaceae bacterium]|nr:FtsW/RodA/SpoVE family cell cycle protein [Synergistaceae bacterium]